MEPLWGKMPLRAMLLKRVAEACTPSSEDFRVAQTWSETDPSIAWPTWRGLNGLPTHQKSGSMHRRISGNAPLSCSCLETNAERLHLLRLQQGHLDPARRASAATMT